MKALRYHGPGRLAIEEVPVPEVRDGDVLIEVRACGICATDVKTFQRGHPKIRPGTVLGHEIAGVVVKAPGNDGWRPGDEVVVAPYVPCGTCEACRRGDLTLCRTLFDELPEPGGFAEYIRVRGRLRDHGLLRKPTGLSFDEATLAEPIACSIRGINRLQVGRGDVVVVVGDGPMGILHAALARRRGASWIGLAGRIAERLAVAASYADAVSDGAGEDLAAWLRREAPARPNRIAVTVPSTQAAIEALELVAPRGTVNLFAGFPSDERLELDPNRIHYDEVTLVGSFGFAPAEFASAVALLDDGALDVRRLITNAVPLADAVAGFEAAMAYRGVKTVVRP
jgi:L-iditol 2-dehydrogenase